ncbi:hypothetical protein CEXT_21981 [Caerostris extrusa]|uniref:Uncharacterized protein n=1 Tax=Caerostris extrusa TaxID=172846 RepID=A0AAV4MI13_CAEEX|nr:hypothetical protein CEXT_21981 [Caerostris extrusa]
MILLLTHKPFGGIEDTTKTFEDSSSFFTPTSFDELDDKNKALIEPTTMIKKVVDPSSFNTPSEESNSRTKLLEDYPPITTPNSFEEFNGINKRLDDSSTSSTQSLLVE